MKRIGVINGIQNWIPVLSKRIEKVAVLETDNGERLIIRSNPTVEEVQAFVTEQNRRYHAGEKRGSDAPALLVHEGNFYPTELDINDDSKKKPIKLEL